VELRSARRYLAVWAVVLFVALLSVLVVTYTLLAAVGVLGSVSQALALVSDDAPSSGLVPVLQPQHVLPLLFVVSLALSGLLYVLALGALLVHNATTSLTGGLRVRVRPETPLRRGALVEPSRSGIARS
jgi:hypothetical protein